MSKLEELIKVSIESNMPILIKGETGTGKSSIVKQVAKELGYDLYDLRLAGIMPEDLGGLPRAVGDSYDYLVPKWFHERMNKPFVLFLDEINQASIQVLHALYGVVLDRMVAGRVNPEMRIVAACNEVGENEYVTDMMIPLLARFPLEYKHELDKKAFTEYMVAKYPNAKKTIEYVANSGAEFTPRSIEFGIKLIMAGMMDMQLLKKLFGELTESICFTMFSETALSSEQDDDQKIKAAVAQIKSGQVMFGGIAIPVDVDNILSKFKPEDQVTIKALAGVK